MPPSLQVNNEFSKQKQCALRVPDKGRVHSVQPPQNVYRDETTDNSNVYKLKFKEEETSTEDKPHNRRLRAINVPN